MKIGIYGGTFDPVHNGHIMVAKAALQQLKLDRVIFVVASDPPHKHDSNRTPGLERLEMLNAGIGVERCFAASGLELKRGGVSYTVETLGQLSREHSGAKLYFIVGADMLMNFRTWHRPEEILKLADLVAIGRMQAGSDMPAQHGVLGDIAGSIESELGGKVIVLNTYGPDISSTKIRSLVSNARSIAEFVPLSVEKYIYTHLLYFDDELKAMGERLRNTLDENRFEHTMLVAREAVMLAERYGFDTKRARIAGMLHDCMKLGSKELIKFAKSHGYELTEDELKYPFTLHGRLGAEIAKCEYGIYDDEILEAIRNHTIGSTEMSMLDKIVFLADKIEPSRTYRRIEHIRKLAYEDLDAAVIAVMRHTMQYTKSRGMAVHPDTLIIIEALERKANKKSKMEDQINNGRN